MTNVKSNTRPSEEAALDRALNSMDPALRASLQRDQKQQRQRLLTGGIVMTILTIVTAGFVFAWSGLAGTANSHSPNFEMQQDAEALSAEGWRLWQSRNLTEAETKFTAAVELDPKLDQAWNGLGWARFNQGKTESAIEAFQKCVDLNKKHVAALNGLGQAHFVLRKYAEAEEYFLKAKDGPAAWYGLMKLYLLQEKFEDAKIWMTKISNLSGPADEGLAEIKSAIEEAKLSDSLRAKIEPPLPAHDTETATHDFNSETAKGWQLFQNGDPASAKVAFERALAAKPDHVPAINGLAFVLLNTGETGIAKPMFEKLITADPKQYGAMNGLARCLKAEGDLDGAIEWWLKFESSSPEVSAATYGLATTYFEQQNFSAALPYLQRLADANPQDADVVAKLKIAEEKSKRDDE